MFQALLLLQVLMAVFMERTPPRPARTSKPSSRTEKDESAIGHAGTHTKGKA
ncbi:MAG: hypothetical protein IPF50_12725 [Proteobacteria bacterium]|nr:hypothetical protein [Pseudomonadota bacterium]